MTQFQSTALPPVKPRFGLLSRVSLIGAACVAEKIFLDQFVDFGQAQAAQGFGALLREAQHWGFRLLVALGAALILFACAQGDERLRSAAAAVRISKVRPVWIITHLACIALLVPLTHALYHGGSLPPALPAVVALWLLVGAAALVFAALAMAPWPLWVRVAQALGVLWWYAAATALVSASAINVSQQLWKPTATLTFNLVRWLLLPVIPSLKSDASTLVLGTDRIAVQIAEVCSGLEGLGLILALTGAWLFYFRREYLFPRSLLLIPIGMAAMFALNVVRLGVLVLIGHAGFPDVAQYGFHSQAGWIAFIAVACALVLFSRRIRWFHRDPSSTEGLFAAVNPTAAYLMPFLAILAAGMVSRALSGSFEIFYPIRLVAGAGVLVLYRHELATLDWRWTWRGPAVGALVFLIWIIAGHLLVPRGAMPAALTALPPAMRVLWIASRVIAAVVTVPIAEELAYRGYLMRRLMTKEFDTLPFHAVRWPAVAATALVFGMAHGTLWLPGTLAGVAFGLLAVRRGGIGEAVAAHITAGALLAAVVLGRGQWQLW